VSGVQVAVLPGGTAPPAIAAPAAGPRRERIGLRVTAFAALGLYGVLRWDTLLSGAAMGRLAGLLVLSAVMSVAGPLLARFSRALAALLFVVGLLAGFVIAGLPLDSVVHLRVAVSARAIGDGLSALPQINVPYVGINQWVRVTLLLGAMILLLDAALVLMFVPRRLGLLRRAGAALPLVALSVIPATALRPRSPYLEGALLFALVVAFVWGEEIESRRLGGVLAAGAVAATVAVGLAPALDSHRAWINYRQLADSLAPGGVETFDWTQGYGPLHWPHTGKAVLYVQASHSDYWKAENLDVFNGQGWVAAPAPESVPWQEGVSPSALHRWTQKLQVTLDSMATNKVIVDGSGYQPNALPGAVLAGTSPGTWESSRRLEPGASYQVSAYAPHPTRAQLASATATYPGALARSYLSLNVPEFPGLTNAPASYTDGILVRAVFPSFGHATATSVAPGNTLQSVMASSPYARAYALAQRLRTGASSPYAYVRRVLRYLGHGYAYDQRPPASRFPLEDFLFAHRLGYCQHFAGAMAMLLRMGGVPARVAVGFTPGTYDRPSHRWVVSDLNAHAWVEAWFPRYGWMRFDPTPSVDPALAAQAPSSTPAGGPAAKPAVANHHHDVGGLSPRKVAGPGHVVAHGSGVSGLVVAPAVLLALMILAALLTRARPGQDPITELTRAFARSGRPLETAATLSGLEERLSYSPRAAAYVRELRLARYAPAARSGAGGSFLRGRRALRQALAIGLGPLGRARAWWALPPRWTWPELR
jgi:transglutaminase-like putative cysteine protease